MENSRTPFPALVLVVDVSSFSGLRNPEMLAARGLLYRLLAEAFEAGGVSWARCAHEDRGDGVLVVAPASVPKTAVMGPVLTELVRRIADAPGDARGRGMKVRIAAHGGEVHQDANGFAGSDVVLPFRLLDSAVLRDALADAPARSAVMVSDALHESTVRHDYPGMNGRVFDPVEVSVKETGVRAWLHVPGGAGGRGRAAPPPARPSEKAVGGNSITAGNDITVENGALAGGDVINDEWRRGGSRRRRRDQG